MRCKFADGRCSGKCGYIVWI
ncbi:hypothetical protein FIU00_02520 [Methylophilus medardicus]|uniref:Uncharacterized protein n=1 Tax=Methylophilus medardicus TaxID=2588534 RepID=A0A5B8CVK8_9PROT|nr:hypothetical protein FIU01_02520 [Methylophilus medardicus]QDC50286.1 hypothetical protein FIU00_02520 [Methylophilus medardicus]QDC53991.1 hypothetical protein FIT99_02520 [Methylophilus medardicus]